MTDSEMREAANRLLELAPAGISCADFIEWREKVSALLLAIVSERAPETFKDDRE